MSPAESESGLRSERSDAWGPRVVIGVVLMAFSISFVLAAVQHRRTTSWTRPAVLAAAKEGPEERMRRGLGEFHPIYAALREQVSPGACVILFAKPNARSEMCLWGLRSALFPARFEIFDALVRLQRDGQLALCDEFWLLEVTSLEPAGARELFLPVVGNTPTLETKGYRLWRAREWGP